MSKQAQLTSIESLRLLRTELIKFEAAVRDALVSIEISAAVPMDWVEHERSRYWPRQFQQGSDKLSESRIALDRCELASATDERRYCYDERKALERAKRRVHLTEEKVQAVRRWRVLMRKELDEFLVQVARTRLYLESDLQQAIGSLLQMSEAIDRYVEQRGPMTSSDRTSESTTNSSTNAAEEST